MLEEEKLGAVDHVRRGEVRSCRTIVQVSVLCLLGQY